MKPYRIRFTKEAAKDFQRLPALKRFLRSILPFAAAAILAAGLTACAELDTLRQIKASQDKRIKELNAGLLARSTEYKKALTQKQYEIDSLNQRLAVADDDLTRLRTQQAETERAAEEDRGKAAQDLDAARKELSQVREVAEERMGEIERTQTALADVQADVATKQTTAESLAKRLHAAEKSLEEARAKVKSSETALSEKEKALVATHRDLAAARKRTEELEKNARNLSAQMANLQKALDASKRSATGGGDTTALTKEMARMERQIKDLDSGDLASGDLAMDSDFQDALTQLKLRLDPADKAGVASVFADSRGVVVRLSADYLFKPGEVDLAPAALPTLDAIGGVLAKFPAKYIDVEGHTDSQPVVNLPFADNWALAATRANKVVRYLTDQAGIDPRRLKSVSCSQYRPLAGPGADAPQAQRRVEIVMRSRP